MVQKNMDYRKPVRIQSNIQSISIENKIIQKQKYKEMIYERNSHID